MKLLCSQICSTQCRAQLKELPTQGAILFLRLSIGVMGLTHGYPKLLLLLEGKGDAWLNPIGLGATCSLVLCTVAEFVGSVGLIAGVFTRLWALLLFINFYVIVFMTKMGGLWGTNEVATLYLICYTSLLAFGGGRFSVDYCLRMRRERRQTLLEKGDGVEKAL